MELSSPCIITSRLMPGVRIGRMPNEIPSSQEKDLANNGATISITYASNQPGSRTVYSYFIDFDRDIIEAETDRAHRFYFGRDLKSGVQGGNLYEGLTSLLGFLGAFAEAVAYEHRTGRQSENLDLFPSWMKEWAYLFSEEIATASCDLEQNPDAIKE